MKKVLESRKQREEQSKQRAQSAGMALVVRWTSAGCALESSSTVGDTARGVLGAGMALV